MVLIARKKVINYPCTGLIYVAIINDVNRAKTLAFRAAFYLVHTAERKSSLSVPISNWPTHFLLWLCSSVIHNLQKNRLAFFCSVGKIYELCKSETYTFHS